MRSLASGCRTSCWSLWRETRKTILFITHSVDEAVYLSTRPLVMSPRPGRIMFDESAIFTETDEWHDPDDIRALPAYGALRRRSATPSTRRCRRWKGDTVPAERARAGADTVLVGGTVRTLDPVGRTTTALALRDGRVLAVGTDRDMAGLAHQDARVLDLGGRTFAVPGFIETHTHPAFWGLTLDAAVEAGTPPNETAASIGDGPFSERVLVVEDDRATRYGLTELVRSWGYLADGAADGEEALQKVTTFRPGIIISDLVMPRMDGLALLRSLRDQLSDIVIILLTAQGSVETAVEAIKEGAYDYLTKPVDTQRLLILLKKAVERQETLREVRVLRRQLREQGSFGRMIGNTPLIRQIYRTIEQAAPTAASVLISGESGTGKEMVAQTIHQLSQRAPQPYVPINCAAIPETLLESEIFGHEKGAFTGAVERVKAASN